MTSVLTEAEKLINGDRRDDYGSALDSFTVIADLWSPVLGVKVTAEEVALCMIQLKVARSLNGLATKGEPQHDSLVDIAGYAGCLEKIVQERTGRGDAS